MSIRRSPHEMRGHACRGARQTSHPELATIVARIAASLETFRPMVLDPDPSDGRRLAIGMAPV